MLDKQCVRVERRQLCVAREGTTLRHNSASLDRRTLTKR